MSTTKTNDLILHGFGRTTFAPDVSSFVVKLETFLRLAKIDYQYQDGSKLGPKSGRCPWVEYTRKADGQKVIVEGTETIIAALFEEYQPSTIVPAAALSADDQILGFAMREVLHSSLYHTVLRQRWVDTPGWIDQNYYYNLPMFFKKLVIRKLQRPRQIEMLNGHGNGDLTPEESLDVMLKDVQYLEWLLKRSQAAGGSFVFSSSGSKPSAYDAAVYAFLGAIAFAPLNSPAQAYILNSAVLSSYVDRVAKLAFPDLEALKEQGVRKLANERKKDWIAAPILIGLAAVLGGIGYGVVRRFKPSLPIGMMASSF